MHIHANAHAHAHAYLLQRAEAPHTARPAAQRIGNKVPRGVVTPRLAALGGRREHVMRLLAQMHGAPDQGSLQAELVASLREEMRALQRERLALLQLAALRPNLSKARAAAGRKTRPPSTLPQVCTALCTAPAPHLHRICTALHLHCTCTALHRTALHCTCTAPHCAALCSALCTALHRICTALHLHRTAPHCTVTLPTPHSPKVAVRHLGAAHIRLQAPPHPVAAPPHSYGCRLRSSSSTA